MLLLWLVSLPLGTTAQEVLTGLALLTAGWMAWQRPALRSPGPLAAPVLLWVLAAWAQTLNPDGAPELALGRTWVATAVWTVPVLARAAGPGPWLYFGAMSAGVVTALAVAQGSVGLGAGVGGLGFEGHGLYSHHLTLAYAWVVLICMTWEQGWLRTSAWLAAGVLATGSLGALVGLVLGAAVAWLFERHGRLAAQAGVLGAGVVGVLLLPLSPAAALAERSVLWTAGARLGVAGGAPPGAWRQVVDPVHRQLDADFFFPHHAHDVWLQALADAGPAAWVALAWAGAVLLRRGGAGVLAMVTALTVGGLTQDWLGDVEVARMVLVWTSLALYGALPGRHAPREVPLASAPRVQPH